MLTSTSLSPPPHEVCKLDRLTPPRDDLVKGSRGLSIAAVLKLDNHVDQWRRRLAESRYAAFRSRASGDFDAVLGEDIIIY